MASLLSAQSNSDYWLLQESYPWYHESRSDVLKDFPCVAQHIQLPTEHFQLHDSTRMLAISVFANWWWPVTAQFWLWNFHLWVFTFNKNEHSGEPVVNWFLFHFSCCIISGQMKTSHTLFIIIPTHLSQTTPLPNSYNFHLFSFMFMLQYWHCYYLI